MVFASSEATCAAKQTSQPLEGGLAWKWAGEDAAVATPSTEAIASNTIRKRNVPGHFMNYGFGAGFGLAVSSGGARRGFIALIELDAGIR